MRKIVGVSLGSPKGDKTVTKMILGEEFEVSRIGTNGDMRRFAEMMRELDGKVDALTLGGCDLYVYAGDRRFTIREIAGLAANAKITPVVDGSGLKNTLERETIEWLQREGVVDFTTKNVFMMSGTDRFGMSEALAGHSKAMVFGDLMFALGIPIPIRSWNGVKRAARALLPIVCLLPFKWLYPTGEKQNTPTPKYEQIFRWADVIAGDNKYIVKYMPTPESGAMKDKVVITNTLTPDEVESLRVRGVKTLITGTIEFEGGRTFGTNVMEGIIITLAGKRPDQMIAQDYLDTLRRLDWKPTIRDLQSAG